MVCSVEVLLVDVGVEARRLCRLCLTKLGEAACEGVKAKTADTKSTRSPYFLAASILAYFPAFKLVVRTHTSSNFGIVIIL